MDDKKKKLIRNVGIVAIVAGTAGVYIGGGSEGYTIEIVSAVFAAIGLVTGIIKKWKA